MDNLKINIDDKDLTLQRKNEGQVEILQINLKVIVEKGSFLHIGASPSLLTEKKGAVFKVDRTPVIPASSFKGALRNQMELLLIQKLSEFKTLFYVEDENTLKPCIPAPKPSKAEQELLTSGYRSRMSMGNGKNRTVPVHCEVRVDENGLEVPELGICPICYFMGATGIMGFLRFSNLYPPEGDWLIDQTNIRIDRKIGTAAKGAKVDGEQVKPGTKFEGIVEIINKTPQGLEFGKPRKIGEKKIDCWLEGWSETDDEKRKQTIIQRILLPAIQNIKFLGGHKSKGAGKVKVEIDNRRTEQIIQC